jgi:hypothetical protein
MSHTDSPSTPHKRRLPAAFFNNCPDTPTANMQCKSMMSDNASTLQRRDSAFHSLDTEYLNSLSTTTTSTPIGKKVNNKSVNSEDIVKSIDGALLSPDAKEGVNGSSSDKNGRIWTGDGSGLIVGGRGGRIKSTKLIAYRISERW